MSDFENDTAELEAQDAATLAILNAHDAEYGEVAYWSVKAELEDGLEIEVVDAHGVVRYYSCVKGVVTCLGVSV